MDYSTIEPLNRVFLQLGPITIYWYAVFIMSGVALGLFLAIREGKKMGINSEFFYDLVTYGLPISIIGARIYYVAFSWDYYSSHPEDIIKIWQGGIAIHGAIIAAFIFGYFFCKKRKVSFWLVADIASVSFIIAQAIGRWGNFMNQEAHGGVVPGATLDAQREFLQSLFIPDFIVNNMYINEAYYHPTFLYESLWNMVGFLFIVFVLRKLPKLLVGEIAAFYAVWYSIGRYMVEGMRTDSLMLTESIRMAQFISITTIVLVLILVIYRRLAKKNLITYQSFYVKNSHKE
ncbi:MAG: prolipoprotein diacylglyceryl transferase [Turicibacter sp.]|nr:prolipoprotein diacylglyceryl transferase [Turicibacter sp.]MDD6761357.1 prolipoprotein diacylglyceryl transferase [Turicibacter sp.]